MSELIQGENAVLASYNSTLDAWVAWGCDTNCTLSVETDFIETTVSGQGSWRTIKPSRKSWTGGMEGLTSLDNTNLISLPDLRAKQYTDERILIRFTRTGQVGHVYVTEGYCYIRSSSDSSPVDAMESFSVSLEGDGALTDTFTPTQLLGNVKRFEYTGIGGETFFTSVKDQATGNTISLINKFVIGFEKDGIGFSKMITTGTPVDKEYKFVQSTGRIDVPMAFAAGEEAHGYYRD